MSRRCPLISPFEARLRKVQQEVDDLSNQRATMRAWMRRVISGEDGNT